MKGEKSEIEVNIKKTAVKKPKNQKLRLSVANYSSTWFGRLYLYFLYMAVRSAGV